MLSVANVMSNVYRGTRNGFSTTPTANITVYCVHMRGGFDSCVNAHVGTMGIPMLFIYPRGIQPHDLLLRHVF
jgi:hypothetical protein